MGVGRVELGIRRDEVEAGRVEMGEERVEVGVVV